jgi:ABC-2 type transport system permease protein
MSGAIFFEALRQTRRQMLYWGIGLGLIGFLVVTMVPDVEGLKQMAAFLESMPPIILRAVGVGNDLTFFTTPDGFVATGFFGKSLLLLAAYPIVMGLRVTVNEEDSGTIDMLLSLPVPRWRVILEKFLAYAMTLVVIVALLFVSLWAGTVVSGVKLNMERVALTTLNILPSMLLILAFTLFIGALIGRKRLAVGIVTAFVIGSFMLDIVGAVGKGSFAEQLRALSFFSYYDSTGVMQSGWCGRVIPLAVAAIRSVGRFWSSSAAMSASERKRAGQPDSPLYD